MDLVSVIIPLYNTEAYIEKAIVSILEQTYSNLELLICDDGSTDSSLAVAKEWEAKDSRVRVLVNEQNKGHIYTYNRLFFAAKGEYIMVQDSDDWSEPARIEIQLNTLKNVDVDVCFVNSIYHRSNGTFANCPSYDSTILNLNSPENYDPATIFFKRSILEVVPGFHAYFDRLVAMDRYFILQCLCNFKCFFLNEYLYHVLIRANSDHRSFSDNNIRKISVLEAYRLLKEQRIKSGSDWLQEGKEDQLIAYEMSILKDKKFMSEKYRVFSCIQIDEKKINQGWSLLKKAIWLNPFNLTNYSTLLYLIRAAV